MITPESHLPPPELQEYIASYGILDIPKGKTESYFSPPLAMSGFIINLGPNRDYVNCKIEGRDFFTEPAVASGQVTAPVYGKLIGEVKSFLIFFKPTGMHRLFGNDLSKLTNTSIPLSKFLGPAESGLLYNNLISQHSKERKIEVLNEFFRRKRPLDKEEDQFEAVLDYIHGNNGNVSISEIEASTSFSRKTLERHFKRKVGLSPKVYSQIYQFKCLINFLQMNPEITWTQLANHSGYFDQSHMSRYVKEYLQVSPNSLVKLDMQFINFLLNR